MTAKVKPVLTLHEAVELLALAERFADPVRWLRRHLLKIERETRTKLLVRVGQGTKRPTYRVRRNALLVACAEFVDVNDHLTAVADARDAKLMKHLHAIDESLGDLRADVVAIAEGRKSPANRPRFHGR